MVNLNAKAPAARESRVSSLLQVQLHWMMRLLESTGTQVKIIGLTVSIHILTLQSLRLLWIVSNLFFINSQPFQTHPPHGIHSLLNELLLPIASLLTCLVMLLHVLVKQLDCHSKVCWNVTFILMRYWWLPVWGLLSSKQLWLYSQFVLKFSFTVLLFVLCLWSNKRSLCEHEIYLKSKSIRSQKHFNNSVLCTLSRPTYKWVTSLLKSSQGS